MPRHHYGRRGDDDVVDGELVDEHAGKALTLSDRLAVLAVPGAEPVDPDDLVSADTDDMLREGVPQNTIDAYNRQWKRFVLWCGRDDVNRKHMPATSATVREYINAHWTWTRSDGVTLAGRYGRPYAPSTLEQALAVISMVHQWHGLASPTRHRSVSKQLRAYRKRWKRAGYMPDKAAALTIDELAAMVRSEDVRTLAGLRNAVMMRVHIDIGCRGAELCDLLLEHVTFLTQERVILHIAMSKADQDAEGRDVPLEADDEFAPDICPVKLLRAWIGELRAHGMTRGPLFRQVYAAATARKDWDTAHVRAGTMRKLKMTRGAYEKVFLRAAAAAGVMADPETGKPRRVTTHTPRASFITNAVDADMQIAEIAAITGHSLASPVIHGYYRSGRKFGDRNPAVRIRRAHRRTPAGAAA
ncbi:tyrosine-type recombinase/integrase [Dactylosporangium sp. CS-033363]|uniref:tyrosine-type recombinase/integrase n=1 Tax=Dactylosporangium sp. CS-033363 TaxID=3239935 RepID=UPI003D93422D